MLIASRIAQRQAMSRKKPSLVPALRRDRSRSREFGTVPPQGQDQDQDQDLLAQECGGERYRDQSCR